MSQSNLISNYYDDSVMPQLARHYVDACYAVYKFKPYIHRRIFPKFSIFEDDLREQAIPPKEFAFTVIAATKWFVKKKSWKFLPIKLFLSDYGIKKYLKVEKYKTVDVISAINSDEILKMEILHNEIVVARAFIAKNVKSDTFIRLRDIVEELKPLLSEVWLEIYVNKGKRPISQAIDRLSDEFQVFDARTYTEMLDMLR